MVEYTEKIVKVEFIKGVQQYWFDKLRVWCGYIRIVNIMKLICKRLIVLRKNGDLVN